MKNALCGDLLLYGDKKDEAVQKDEEKKCI